MHDAQEGTVSDNERRIREYMDAWGKVPASELADFFTEDAIYCDELGGEPIQGREAIRAAIVKVMAAAPPDMFFPTPWHVIEGNRVVYYPVQALPDPKGGDEKYEFACVTILDYAGHGEFSYQEDVYNPRAGEQTFKRWIAAGGTLPAHSDLLG